MISNLQAETVPYTDFACQHRGIAKEVLSAIEAVLEHGQFINGPEVDEFEKKFAAYCGTRYAVGVGNGTDALVLALKAVGVSRGDEVITVPNTFLSTVSAIILAGGTPVLIDVCDDFNLNPELLETAITARTKAVVPVHLTGRPVRMNPILKLAQKYGIAAIEDAAQAVGARYYDQRVGSIGLAGCFSLHPLKNLSACGDGGILTTSDDKIYEYLIKARNHGLEDRNTCGSWGINSRLDSLQAAILLKKWSYLDAWTKARRANARYYRKHLANVVEVPQNTRNAYAVYHTFIIQTQYRDDLQIFLKRRGIDTRIHYPVPIHLQPAARALGYRRGDFPVAERQAQTILSLPIYPELTQDQLDWVVESIHEYFER